MTGDLALERSEAGRRVRIEGDRVAEQWVSVIEESTEYQDRECSICMSRTREETPIEVSRGQGMLAGKVAPRSSAIRGLGSLARLLDFLKHLLEFGTTGFPVWPVVDRDIVPGTDIST